MILNGLFIKKREYLRYPLSKFSIAVFHANSNLLIGFRCLFGLCGLPWIKILAMSGLRGNTTLLNMAKLIGANEVLLKPFSDDELLIMVEALLMSV